MDCEYSKQLEMVCTWASECFEHAYLSEALFQAMPVAIDELKITSTGDDQQPLLVAFLGGTGVGKSSLLNRLAGEAIANSGIVRPTSKEVTLFHHESLVLDQLPTAIPFTTVKVKHHHDENNRHVIWLDMPDFDSIETNNQQQVLDWLPHIDILIYVVSPERYRDWKAWELLLAEGGKHAWLFVMNHWDTGVSAQFEDLQHQLTLAGFTNPLMYKTSCLTMDGDDFVHLVQQIQYLSGQLQRQLLSQIQTQRRFQELADWLNQVNSFFLRRDYVTWHANVETIWQRTALNLQQGLEWSLQENAQFVAENIGPLRPLAIWDAWAQSRFDDALDDIALSAIEYGFPHNILRNDFLPVRKSAGKIFHHECELALRRALANPGNRWQRVSMLVAKLAETLLPLLAMAVVGYEVFVGFYQSSVEERAYLGVEFAIHSGLLIGLSWLIPFYLHRKLQPSRKTTAINGLHHGAKLAFHSHQQEIDQVCLKQAELHNYHLDQLTKFKQVCLKEEGSVINNSDIERMLSQH